MKNNTELNNALMNMGYRYMGIKDDNHIWGKPVGTMIIIAAISYKMHDITIKSICEAINSTDENKKKLLTFDSISFNDFYKEEYKFADCSVYDDYLKFIIYAEQNICVDQTMQSGKTRYKNCFEFAFNDYYQEQLFIKY